jgi:hypothetical protein
MPLPSACGFDENPLLRPNIGGMEGVDEMRSAGKKQAFSPFFRRVNGRSGAEFKNSLRFIGLALDGKLPALSLSAPLAFINLQAGGIEADAPNLAFIAQAASLRALGGFAPEYAISFALTASSCGFPVDFFLLKIKEKSTASTIYSYFL